MNKYPRYWNKQKKSHVPNLPVSDLLIGDVFMAHGIDDVKFYQVTGFKGKYFVKLTQVKKQVSMIAFEGYYFTPIANVFIGNEFVKKIENKIFVGDRELVKVGKNVFGNYSVCFSKA